MGSDKMNFSFAGQYATETEWIFDEVAAPFEYIVRQSIRGQKWQFGDFARFIYKHGSRRKIAGRTYTVCDLCDHRYWILGDDPDKAGAIKRLLNPLDKTKLQAFREYVAQVKWQFAKTYAKKSPHEYTVKEWNQELESKMIETAWFIKGHGRLEMFNGYPYIVFFLDGWKYWTMDDNPDETDLINRTPVGGYVQA